MKESSVYIDPKNLRDALMRDAKDLETGCSISPYYLADICKALAYLLEKK